ncbi:MAG: MobV family relaxase [Tenuifilaceae bacterium]|jgi:hypothetical protein|nr:MobV family relaxase [Tenuifilaceae bacterium]
MANYAVLHAEKCKGNLTGIGQHIDREHTPHNADPERAHLNQELVQPRSRNLTDDVNHRIKEGYTKKKAIRKDAVKAMRVVLSGSPEQMQRIGKDEKQFKAWKKANLEFFSERFGKDNLVRFSLHMDETTPHIHAVVVPISPDGELSAKKMFGGPKELQQLQSEYASAMKPFGLDRGKENSTAKHTDIKEYYARVNNQEHLFPEVEIPSKKFLESEEAFQKRGQKELAPIFEALEKAKRINGQLRGDNERLKKEVVKAKQEILNHYQRGAKEFAKGVNMRLEAQGVNIRFEAKEVDRGIQMNWTKIIPKEEQKEALKPKKGGLRL